MIVWSHVLLAGLWGGLLALERSAFLQAMFSRPLVAATGTGLLLEDLPSGIFVGLVFELFYLGGVSLGGSRPEHETLPAVTAAAAAAAIANASGGPGTPAMWTLGILLCAPLGRVGALLERAIDRRALRYHNRAQASTDAGQLQRAVRQNLRAMWPHLVGFGLLSAAAALIGYLVLVPLESALPLSVVRGLAWAYPAMASVAAAVAVHGSRTRSAVKIAIAAAAAVVAVAAAVAMLGSRAP
ncbi:MAG: mannose component [Myxococcaceae bacterium]|nr:mannose component [Myxococcaceae bacterium]